MICGILCVTSISRGAQTQPAKADPKKAPSNAAPAVIPPTNSVFVIPVNEKEGRDPFYPKSRYIYAKAPVQTPTVVAAVKHADLKFQGISGPANRRLAIINGRTFEPGEEAEVNTPEGRITIKLLEAKGNTVVVQAAGERQTLTLPGGL